MNNFLKYTTFIFLLGLTGCVKDQALIHSYQGDIHVRTLTITVDPIPDAAGEDDVYQSAKKLQKIIQEVEEIFDPQKSEQLMTQLALFQNKLVDGIRSATQLPIVASEDVEIIFDYGDESVVQEIRFEFPDTNGATLDLYANVFCPSSTSEYIGMEDLNRQTVELVPQLDLQIDGQTQKGDSFWRKTVSYTSPTAYTVGNNYIFGVATDRIQDGKIFLLPLADGLVAKLGK